jgi:hypothetical protein
MARTKKSEEKKLEESLADTYNKFKEFEGQRYTGMKIGRGHKWHYDSGVWKEKKITPDMWEFNYAVVKRRAGKAPEGSGVPEGTAYHWYILAHQNVCKLDANSYTTAMSGFKYKVAHKRADKDKWNISDRAQRRRLIKLLHEMTADLEFQEEQAEKAKQKEKEAKAKAKPKSKKSPVRKSA